MVCNTPSSETLKSSLARVFTRCCLSSSTVAFKTTSSTLRCRVYFPLSRPITVVVSGSLGAPLPAPSGETTGSRSTLSGCCFSAGSWEAEGGGGACIRAGSGELQSRKIGMNSQLLQGRIVSGTGVSGELGQPLGWNQLYLQFTPLAVPFNILRPIPQHVLIAQFGTYLGSN